VGIWGVKPVLAPSLLLPAALHPALRRPMDLGQDSVLACDDDGGEVDPSSYLVVIAIVLKFEVMVESPTFRSQVSVREGLLVYVRCEISNLMYPVNNR
jgi:hypothetical protein